MDENNNVVVRVGDQEFIRGEDGYSPVVTVEEIEHGHRVNITDREHPEGQSFDVLDGASAYEQAVAGGYQSTEEQFAYDLASFKSLSEQAAASAAAAQTAQGLAETAQAAAEAAQSAAEGYADSASSSALLAAQFENNASGYAVSANAYAGDAEYSASVASSERTAAEAAEAEATRQAGIAETQASAAATSAGEASTSATNAAASAVSSAASATAAGNAQTAAEAAQGLAETAQAAAETAQGLAETAAESVSDSAEQISQNAADISDLKSATNKEQVIASAFSTKYPFIAKNGDTITVETASGNNFVVGQIFFYSENGTQLDYWNLKSINKSKRTMQLSVASDVAYIMIKNHDPESVIVTNESQLITPFVLDNKDKISSLINEKESKKIAVGVNTLATKIAFFAKNGDSITIKTDDGSNFSVSNIRFYDKDQSLIDYANLSSSSASRTYIYEQDTLCAYIEINGETAQNITVVNNNTLWENVIDIAVRNAAVDNELYYIENETVFLDTLDERKAFFISENEAFIVKTSDGSAFTSGQLRIYDENGVQTDSFNLKASGKSQRDLTYTSQTRGCYVAIVGQTAQETIVVNTDMSIQDYLSAISEFANNNGQKCLAGKQLWTVWDSLGENKWQPTFAGITGCIFDATKNTSNVKPISKGGTMSLPYLDDGTQARAINLVSYKGTYPIDVVILENINDKSWLSHSGQISDQPFMREQRIHVDTGATSRDAAISYAESNLASILQNTASASRKKGTVLTFGYTSGSTVCGSKITFTGQASTEGDIIVSWGTENFSVHVTTGMTVQQIAAALTQYSFGPGVTDTDNGDGSVTITYYTGTDKRVSFNANGTGVTATVADSVGQGVYPIYFYGYTASEWENTAKWSDEITLYSVYKGLIEYLVSELPEAAIYWSMPWNVNIDFTDSTYKNADETWSEDKFKDQPNNEDTVSLYTLQKTVCEYYNIPYFDLYRLGGMNIINAETYFYTNNPHPKDAGYQLWAEKMAKMISAY